MAILPQGQRQQTMLLVAILAVAAGALYFNFIHRPGALELVESTDRVEDLENQNQIAEARVGNLQQLRDRIDLAESQFELVQRLVPSNAEVPAIYEAIATESQALDLRLINVEPVSRSLRIVGLTSCGRNGGWRCRGTTTRWPSS